MYSPKALFFVLCANLVFCKNIKKQPCDFADSKCVTAAAKLIYPVIIAGIPDKVPSSDPIALEAINLEIDNLKVTLKDVTLKDMSTCQLTKTDIYPKESYSIYDVECKTLNIEGASYEATGQLSNAPVKGSGPLKIAYNNARISFTSHYIKTTDKDGNIHTHIEKFTLEANAEKVTPEFEGLSLGDIANEENSIKFEECIRIPLLRPFIQKHIEYCNQFLSIVPVQDILYKKD